MLRFYRPMRSWIRFFWVFSTCVASAAVHHSAVGAAAYVIVDAQTGYVFEEQAPRKKLQVGSLTKIATAMVVLDWSEQKSSNLNATIAVPQEAFLGASENPIGFQPGDMVTMRDLLYAAL